MVYAALMLTPMHDLMVAVVVLKQGVTKVREPRSVACLRGRKVSPWLASLLRSLAISLGIRPFQRNNHPREVNAR